MINQDLYDRLEKIPEVEEALESYLTINEFEQSDVDPVDAMRHMLNIVIDLLEQTGIIFHCDRSELWSNFHDADYVLDLYENFTPEALIAKHDSKTELGKILLTHVIEGSENIVRHLLEYEVQTDPTQYERDRWVYLHDKVGSNDLFVEGLKEITIGRKRLEMEPERYSWLVKQINAHRRIVDKLIGSLITDYSYVLETFELELLTNRFGLDLLSSDYIGPICSFRFGLTNHLISRIRTSTVPPEGVSGEFLMVKRMIDSVSDWAIFGTEINEKEFSPLHLDNDRFLNEVKQHMERVTYADDQTTGGAESELDDE